MNGKKIVRKNLFQTHKNFLKSALHLLGLYKYSERILLLRKTRYRSISRFTTNINGVSVQFSTEDEYSNSWFFPRYAGNRIHERAVTEMLIETLKGAKCFVDVGTNLGWYTCLASKHMSSGVVYGFEMDDLNFTVLKKNLALNGCGNALVQNVAVSDSPGTVSYRRQNNRPRANFHLEATTSDEDSFGIISVKSISLDNFFDSQENLPDVIKIDVEGAEMNVLKGMSQLLRDCRLILFFGDSSG